MFRKFLAVATLLAAGCSTTTSAPVVSPVPSSVGSDSGEASLLRLEDRREYDRSLLTEWASHPDPERRRRAAIAIGRIGVATFEDLDGDGWQDDNEPAAGTSILLALTGDPDPTVRAAVAFALGETGDLRGAEALFTLAGDEEPLVAEHAAEAISKLVPEIPFERYETLLSPAMPDAARYIAARYLFRYETDRASGNAALLLDSLDVRLRREAIYSLSRHSIPQSRRRVEALLGEADVLTRAYAARALGRIASPTSIAPLLASAVEPHAWIRTNALRSLGQILDQVGNQIPDDDYDQIATVAIELTDDPDSGTAATAIELVGRLAARNDSARERLQRVVRTGSGWHRELGVLWMARSFGPESVESIAAIDDKWLKIRLIEGTSAAERGNMVRARYSTDEDPSVRAAAIGNIPTPVSAEDLELVTVALEDDDPVVRAAAIGFVPAALPDDAIRLLREAESRARSDEMNDARLAAIDALGEANAPDYQVWLRLLLADEDPVVRRVAAEQLTTLEGRRPQYTPLPVEKDPTDYEEIVRWASRPHVVSLVLPRGELRIALSSDEAPMTAWNFATLASQGYFDGTTFMRVVPNFVIQGGDPRNDMSGGPGYAIRDEMNMLDYERGAVGMALSGPDTGGSQFFVTHSPQPHLDGGYTIFGHVISGRGTIIDRIERGDRVISAKVLDADWTKLEIDKVAGVPLPTVIGEMPPETLMRIVPEYPERRESYSPDPDVISYLSTLVQPEDRITVALGTWCHDSQREVPRLLRILDELRGLGVEIPARFIAVDREKKEPLELTGDLSLELVATIIYYRDGVELGRIVETPEGLLEDHLLRIVAAQ